MKCSHIANGKRHRALSAILLCLVSLGMLVPFGYTPARAAGPGPAIAFVRTTANDGDQIWLVAPDGSNPHAIYSPGKSSDHPQADIGMLTWKPDATELAFSSDHESLCSTWEYDLYSIRPNGSGYRRITNAPACAEFAHYPKGSVNVPVENLSAADVVVSFQGDPDLQFGPPGYSILTFDNVADLGSVSQLPVAMLTYSERTPGASGVDIVAGGAVNVPDPLDVGTSGYGMVGAYWPSWNSSGDKLSYVFGATAPREIPANPPLLGWGSGLLAPGTTMPGFITDLAWSPNPAKAGQLLYRSFDLDHLPYNHIYRATEGSSTPGEILVTPVSDGQDYLGLAWLPDASGFVYSELDPGEWGATDHANIYRYDFATGRSTQLTDFSANDYAARLSVGPTGQIVFERTTAKDRLDPIDLWVMDANGSNMHLLADDAHSPAWSPHDLPTYRSTYLPFAGR